MTPFSRRSLLTIINTLDNALRIPHPCEDDLRKARDEAACVLHQEETECAKFVRPWNFKYLERIYHEQSIKEKDPDSYHLAVIAEYERRIKEDQVA